MTELDTGDTILHRPSGMQHDVACVHGDHLYTTGYPEFRLLVESCELLRKATPGERADALTKMAGSSAFTHRPRCARARLAQESAES